MIGSCGGGCAGSAFGAATSRFLTAGRCLAGLNGPGLAAAVPGRVLCRCTAGILGLGWRHTR